MEIHQSAVKDFMMCGKKFEYTYINKVPRTLPEALLVGSAFHYAMTEHFLHGYSLADTQALFEIEIMTLAHQRSDPRFVNGSVAVWERGPEEAVGYGKVLLEEYWNTALPLLHVMEVAKSLKRNIPNTDITIAGELDFIDASGKIVDWKVKERVPYKTEIQDDLQPTFYSFLVGGPITFEFHYILKQKTPKVRIARTTRSATAIRWMTDEMLPRFARSVETGLYLANPTGWWCSPKWCSFYKECRGEPNPEPEVIELD
jgi:hypothetical protein